MRAGAHGVLSSSVDWILRYMYKHNLNTIKSINQKFIPHKLQSSTTYLRHQWSNVERGKLKCNTYKTLSPIINYS